MAETTGQLPNESATAPAVRYTTGAFVILVMALATQVAQAAPTKQRQKASVESSRDAQQADRRSYIRSLSGIAY